MLLLRCVPIATGFSGTGRSTRFSSRSNESGTFKSASTARSASSSETPRLSACSYSSSRCCVSSSAISISRAGARLSPARRALTSAFQSGILDSGDSADCFHELEPAVTLAGPHLFAGRGEAIITSPPLPCLFHPAAANPSPFFEPVKQGIKGSDIKPKSTARPQLDQLTNVVAVPGPILDQRKNKQLRATLLQFTIQAWRRHILLRHVCWKNIQVNNNFAGLTF